MAHHYRTASASSDLDGRTRGGGVRLPGGSVVRRAAMSISVVLAAWAQAPARPGVSDTDVGKRRESRRRIRDAEKRREAAMVWALLLPRQF
jgi:hypothetical protein